MNLSQVTIESQPEDSSPKFRAEEARLLKILEALQEIQSSKGWSTLKTEVFDNLVNVLEKELRTEAERLDPNASKLNRIVGKLEWARRYSDLQKFEGEKRVELKSIRLQLHGKTEETG